MIAISVVDRSPRGPFHCVRWVTFLSSARLILGGLARLGGHLDRQVWPGRRGVFVWCQEEELYPEVLAAGGGRGLARVETFR